ncbi:ZP domain-containing protein [Camponotus japonicus]
MAAIIFRGKDFTYRTRMRLIAVILVVAFSGAAMGQDFGGHALFVRTPDADAAHSRVQRAAAPTSPADVMAQNILEWIQGIYQQGARKTRQQSDSNAYLPPFSTQRPPEKPRPFQPSGVTSFPAQRPSSLYTPPNTGGYPGSVQPLYSTPRPSFPSQPPSPTYVPQSFSGSTSYNPRPSQPSYSNAGSSAFPPLSSPESSSTYLPPQSPSIPTTSPRPPLPESTIGGGYQSSIGSTAGGYSPGGSAGTLQPPVTGGYSTPGGFSTYGYPSERPTPSFPTPGGEGGGYPSSSYPSGSTSTGYPSSTPGGPFPPFTTPGTTSQTGSTEVDEDLKHPPHIHNLDVECSKTMMTINIEFNRAFDGVIYSKGFYMNPECRYVEQNSGQTQYSFTVNLESCGTQFINDFEGEAGQAYLENVLVLQNEPGIQEVWDTVRRVRCLWEGNINKALTVNFSVDMLNQEIVTFSGDTATAKLDIQIGKGPFAPAADGLVKIGEAMTLVVSVEGDPGFDLQVRDCVARDEASTNMLQLTDERGCILKPKLFGAFQKTNDTGNTGASIIAYAFFQAFKFPDVMDLFIECNVELCKTDCEACPEADQQIEPGRRRRSVMYTPTNTSTNPVLLSDPVRVGRRFKVIMLDDLSTASSQILESMEETAVETMTKTKDVCMSNSGFYTTFSLMLSTLFVATISAAVFYIKLQRIRRTKFVDS